jgi:hypothetical protein
LKRGFIEAGCAFGGPSSLAHCTWNNDGDADFLRVHAVVDQMFAGGEKSVSTH